MAKNIKIRLDRHVMHTISFFSLITFHTQYNIQIYFYIMENIKLKKKLPEKPAPQRGHRRWPRAGHGGGTSWLAASHRSASDQLFLAHHASVRLAIVSPTRDHHPRNIYTHTN